MSTSALKRLVEHAVPRLGTAIDHAFPGCFDWRRLCRDTPAMLERATEGAFDPSDATNARVLQERAEAAFRLAHGATLAVRCAMDAGDLDPETLIEQFVEPPEDDEEDRFEALVTESLDDVEAGFEDDDVELDAQALAVRNLVAVTWPSVHELLEDRDAFEAGDDPESAEVIAVARPVLLALVRLAAILAALRWMARYPDADEQAD